MIENKSMLFLFQYMSRLPLKIQEKCGWNSEVPGTDDKGIIKKYWEANTKAVLKAYGYFKYLDSVQISSFDRIYKLLEKEFSTQQVRISDENKLRLLLCEILAKIYAEDDNAKNDVDNLKAMVIIHQCVEKIKLFPKYGNQYYGLLYATYIDNTYNLNAEELTYMIEMSHTHYYRIKQQAIEELAYIMWK